MRKKIEKFFDDEERPEEVVYDPVQVGTVIVCVLSAVGALYWLLWSLLVCGGGIFAKVGPALSVLFTSRTLADYGYEGWPYRLGVFEGWVVNAVSLVVALGLVAALWRFFEDGRPSARPR